MLGRLLVFAFWLVAAFPAAANAQVADPLPSWNDGVAIAIVNYVNPF
jgi:hypothetical protein